MYELNEETGQIDFSHNPFSMPQGGMAALEGQDPLTIKAFQYDIVCNGIELSSGRHSKSSAGHHGKGIRDCGISGERGGGQVRRDAERVPLWGAPAWRGPRRGSTGIVMLLADEPNIREVILFPLNQQGEDLLMGAPAPVPAARLKELSIRLNVKE